MKTTIVIRTDSRTKKSNLHVNHNKAKGPTVITVGVASVLLLVQIRMTRNVHTIHSVRMNDKYKHQAIFVLCCQSFIHEKHFSEKIKYFTQT